MPSLGNMAGSKTTLVVLLLILVQSKACPNCTELCSSRLACFMPGRNCRRRVNCDMTGLNCTSQELGSCLPDSFDGLLLLGHYDSNGTLNPLPTLPVLKELYFGKGQITYVRARAFVTLASVKKLSFIGNSIRVVGKWFDGLKDTKELSLFRNKIKDIERGAFQPMQKLKHLDLTDNRIRNVESWYFEGLTSLSQLKLIRNNISRVAANAFDHIPIKTLYLSYNVLKTLSAEWIEGLSPRASIDLGGNMLSTIGHESIVALRGKFLSVWNNPFRCTCALTSLKTEGKDIIGRREFENLYCSYPPHLAGKKISKLSREDMPCPPPVAKVSRADNGTTLLCEVYWEQQPDISWVGPEGNNISASSNTSGNGITTQLEHTVTPEGHSVSFGTDCSSQDTEGWTLNYTGKSSYKLQMSQEDADFLWWPGYAYRCVITYPVGTFSVSMTLSLISPETNDYSSLTSDDREEGNGLSTDLSRGGVLTSTEMPNEYFLLPPSKHPQYPRMLNVMFTTMVAASVSLLVGFLVGWLICHKTPPKPGDGPAMRDFPPLTPPHLSSLFSLHHYEVIPDEMLTPLLPYAQLFLNPQYGQGNMAQRSSKSAQVSVNPQYGQGRSRSTDVFLNPQYGQGNATRTEVLVNPRYGQGKAKLSRRRWSTPVAALENARLVGLQEPRRNLHDAEGKKSRTPSPHCYMIPQTKRKFRESAGYGKEGCD